MPEDEAEFRRWYGEWATVRPADVPALLEGFDGPWWIAGGYAIEAFTGVERPHEDVDVSLFRRDADRLRARLGRDGTLWSAFLGSLRPFSDEIPEVHPDASQLWLRRDAGSPWLLDLLLNPDRDGRWVNRRHPAMDLPLEQVTWTRDGVRYLAPEVALLFKAKQGRAKDHQDFAAALPLLDGRQRTWLREWLDVVHPGHAWADRLAGERDGRPAG